MATLPTPEESAHAILALFAVDNHRPDDVLIAGGGSTLPSDKPVGRQQNFRLASNTQFKTVGWRSAKTIPSSLRMPVAEM